MCARIFLWTFARWALGRSGLFAKEIIIISRKLGINPKLAEMPIQRGLERLQSKDSGNELARIWFIDYALLLFLSEGRTFGKIRRLQMALIPIIFKFGVLSAMVAFLVAIGMKSLFLLKVLVVMNALAILGKFLTLKTSLFGQYENSAPSFSYPGWNPHAKESWGPTGLSNSPPSAPHPPSKEIHLHIHGNAQTQAQLAGQSYNYEASNGWASRSDPYGAYLPTGQYQEVQRTAEVPNNTDPMALLPTKYPARSLIRWLAGALRQLWRPPSNTLVSDLTRGAALHK